MPESQHPRQARRRAAAALLAASLTLALAAPTSAASSTSTGPNSATAPYILPVADGVHIQSLLTVGDGGSATNGYEMVGIPDGLGMIREGANLVLYMNQELRDTQGLARRHGETGAFVSRYVIDPATGRVKEGSDWINPGVQYWDYPSGTYVTTGARWADSTLQDRTFGRFCSGTLSDPGVFYNEATGNGWKGQIYFGNEEDGDNGRAFGVTKEGDATALPRLGLFSWENTVPAPNQSDTTLVMGQEDGPGNGSQPWVYVGTKQQSGPPVAKAGLTNGDDHVLDAVNQAVSNDAQWRATYGKGVAAPVTLVDNDWNQTGAGQNADALADGLSLNRIEDGHWDPNKPNDFYFLTTEGGQNNGESPTGPLYRDGGGLWLLRWADIEEPGCSARSSRCCWTAASCPAARSGLHKPDNMTIDTHGNLLIQEDPGNVNHLARIVAYRIADGALGVIARFDAHALLGGCDRGPDETHDRRRVERDHRHRGVPRRRDLRVRRPGPHGQGLARRDRSGHGPGIRRARAAAHAGDRRLVRHLRGLTPR